ncbi:glycoside hydrolase family 3 N-terminal domain-containing protein [Microbacterium kyungheense]|uniref:Beta-N-acetylhexosaminidase n=1 Tax=Microbacterium kyungheense TaxID=1263636 RepID=A0A543FKB5_9MICO|nr:glycoside hydrolase family 3 N-terminal domain-containing protein [Microbacterium kyungheense]TQM34281.1 beta-N-acetylhexosaminidase [Microbacterium kyungheense]
MDLEQLVPGVLLPGFAGTVVPEWLHGELERGLGGVCLFAGNVAADDPDGTARLAAAIRAVRPGTLVAADEEGGVVTRLEGRHGSTLPSPAQLGLVAPDVAERVGAVLAERVRRAGIDVVLAPSADVNDNPDNPVIGARSFGADAHEVASRVAATVRGIRTRPGVAACVKHWPGHGDTNVDSHRGLPTIPAATAARHAAPFEAAIEAGVPAVMTAHIVVSEWGPEPVTVNPDAIARLRAAGFDGVVVTDAVDMAAIASTYGIGGGAARALAAGVDLVCLGNPELGGLDAAAQYAEVVDAIVAAVHDGQLAPERLREAHGRVARLASELSSARGTATRTSPVDLDHGDAETIEAALAAASDPSALAGLARIARVVDARGGATQAAATRAVPVADTLRALTSAGADAGASGVTAVVADRPSAVQLGVLADVQAAGECIVVNVGAIPGGFDAAVVQLGADSVFSAGIVRAWAAKGGR